MVGIWNNKLHNVTKHKKYDMHIVTHLDIFDFTQKFQADRLQSILGPFVEPIDSRAIDNTREFSSSYSKSISHRREAQSNLQQSIYLRVTFYNLLLSFINWV